MASLSDCLKIHFDQKDESDKFIVDLVKRTAIDLNGGKKRISKEIARSAVENVIKMHQDEHDSIHEQLSRLMPEVAAVSEQAKQAVQAPEEMQPQQPSQSAPQTKQDARGEAQSTQAIPKGASKIEQAGMKGKVAPAKDKIIATEKSPSGNLEYKVAKIPPNGRNGADHLAYRVEVRMVGSTLDWASAGFGQSSSEKAAIAKFAEKSAAKNMVLNFTDQNAKGIFDSELKRIADFNKSKAEAIKKQDEDDRKRYAKLQADEASIQKALSNAKFKKGDIQITLIAKDGGTVKETINGAHIAGDYAFFKNEDGKYGITHVPTGNKVIELPTIKQAREFTYRASLIDEKWDGKDKPSDSFRAKIAKAKADFQNRVPIANVDFSDMNNRVEGVNDSLGKDTPSILSSSQGKAIFSKLGNNAIPFASKPLSSILQGKTLLDTIDYLIKPDVSFRGKSPDLVKGKAPSPKSSLNGVLSDAKFLRNVIGRDAFAKHGFGGLDVEAQRGVKASMLRASADQKVLDSVVSFVPVNVMDTFFRGKFSTKMLLHDYPMLQKAVRASLEGDVSVLNLPDSLINAFALSVAIKSSGLTSSEFITISKTDSPANVAINLNHAQSPFLYKENNTRPYREIQRKTISDTYKNSSSKNDKLNNIKAIDATRELAGFISKAKESGIDVRIVDDISEVTHQPLKRAAQAHEQRTGRTVEGFYDRNERVAYIITKHAPDMEYVIKKVVHEVIGHGSFYDFMGEHLDPFLEYILRHPRYGEDIKKVGKSRNINMLTESGRKQAAKEWFAKICEDGNIQPNLLSRFVVAFKNALRALGIKNEWLTGFSDKDVAELIRGSRNAIIGKGAKYQTAGLVGKLSGKTALDYSDSPQGQENRIQAAPFTGARNRVMAQLQTWAAKNDIKAKYETLATYLWDSNKAIERVQKGLPPQPVSRDYNLLKRLMGSAITDEIKQFDDKTLKPLLKHMATNKIKVSEVEEFAHAEHAPERNLQMKRVNARGFTDNLMSWMTDTEKAPYKDKLVDIKDEFIMNDQGRAELRDNYIGLTDEIASEVISTKDAKSAELDARQSALDKRTFTPEEEQKGTKERLQNEIDNARGRLEQRLKIAERWESVKDRLSGITNEQAKAITDKYQGNAKMRKAVDMLRDINNATLDMLHDAGELTDGEYEAMKSVYKNHVPLSREDFEDSKESTGRSGVGPLAKPFKLAYGSTKNVSNIFANVIDRHQAAINRKHKLAAGRALVEMVKANPNKDMWDIIKQDKKPYMDSEGNIRFYDDRQEDTNEVYVKVNGERILVSVPKDNKAMMRWMEAVKRNPAPLGPFMKASAKLTRIMAALNTSFAPEFLMTNFGRDFQMAMIHLEDSEGKGLQKEVFRNIKAAIKGIYQAERGNESSDFAKLYREYAQNGGKIGWMQSHENVVELSKQIEKEIAEYTDNPSNMLKVKKMGKSVGKWIEAMNTAVENGVRLSTYKALVDKGVDPKRAAFAAKTLTVDFTQHGTAGPAINSLYMFANAGIQGNVRMIKAIVSNKNVQKIATGIIGFGALANILGVSIGGDDDDGEAYYDKLKKTNPDIFERNMVFMIPGTKGDYFKVPMPYGYNTFFVLGNEAASAIRGKSPVDAMARFGSSLLGTLNPLQAATLLQTIMPTIGDPIAQVMENKAWHGGPLMPEKNPFGIPVPDSERYFKSVNPAAKYLAQGLNSLTGGNKYKSGAIDVSPETFDMIMETYTGAAGRVIKDALMLPFAAGSDDGLSMNKVPFIRKMIGNYTDRVDSTIYRENSNEVGAFAQRLKASAPDERAELQADPLMKMVGFNKQTDSNLMRLNKQLKLSEKMGNKEQADKTRERMTQLKVAYNKRYNELTN